MTADRLDPAPLRLALPAETWPLLLVLPEVSSTQDWAESLALRGAPDGTVVLAEHQTAGRGRAGRRWLAPPGSSLLVSLILRPDLPTDRLHLLTALGGLAVLAGIRTITGLACRLKWPNDIVWAGRKLGGLLTQTEIVGDQVTVALLGLGLNVNFDPALYPDLAASATSLQCALGRPVPRLPLLVASLQALATYRPALQTAPAALHAAWRAAIETLGQTVVVTTPTGALAGLAEDVDERGALIVRTPSGQRVHCLLGEVTVRPADGSSAADARPAAADGSPPP